MYRRGQKRGEDNVLLGEAAVTGFWEAFGTRRDGSGGKEGRMESRQAALVHHERNFEGGWRRGGKLTRT